MMLSEKIYNVLALNVNSPIESLDLRLIVKVQCKINLY